MGCMQSSNGLAAASHTARGYARLLLLTFMFVAFTNSAGAQNANVRPPSNAVTQAVPAAPSGVETWNDDYRVKIWEKLRHGYSGKASIPDPNAGVLVQAEGEDWRELRDRIAADVLEHGYKANVNAFTAANLDAWIDEIETAYSQKVDATIELEVPECYLTTPDAQVDRTLVEDVIRGL